MDDRKMAWTRRREELRLRHGSLDAVLVPCPREAALLEALAPWRVPNPPPHERWTLRLRGWDALVSLEDVPADLLQAAKGACPMPADFEGAYAELAHWRSRDHDIAHALSPDGVTGLGDEGLDPVASLRMRIVREQVEHAMPLSALPEIVRRLEIHRESEFADDRIVGAVLRDLGVIAGLRPPSAG